MGFQKILFKPAFGMGKQRFGNVDAAFKKAVLIQRPDLRDISEARQIEKCFQLGLRTTYIPTGLAFDYFLNGLINRKFHVTCEEPFQREFIKIGK